MNLANLHPNDKTISMIALNTNEKGQIISICLKKGGELKEHVSKTNVILFCITGEIIYQDENNTIETLTNGDYVNINSNVEHKIIANDESQLLLFKY